MSLLLKNFLWILLACFFLKSEQNIQIVRGFQLGKSPEAMKKALGLFSCAGRTFSSLPTANASPVCGGGAPGDFCGPPRWGGKGAKKPLHFGKKMVYYKLSECLLSRLLLGRQFGCEVIL